MSKNHCLYILGIFISGCMWAQESVVSSGGSGSGIGGSNTFSVGQIVYTEIDGPGGSAIQGVQQPYEIFVLGKDDHKGISLNIAAYPNPATSFLTLRIEAAAAQGLRYEIFDLNGRLLRKEEIRSVETSIPMGNYEEATYILNIYSGSNKLKTFKIIKNKP